MRTGWWCAIPAARTTGCSRAMATVSVLCWSRAGAVRADAIDIEPVVVGEYALPDGRTAVPVFQLLAERYLDPQYSPDAVSERCGIPADTIRRIARELAAAAFDSKLVAADRVDRQLGSRTRDDGRPPGVDARDARHQRAQQRLPHLPRVARVAVAARRGRCAGLVPLPAAVPEADAARRTARARQSARRRRARCRAARLRARARRPGRRCRRRAAPHRPRVFVGLSARRRTACCTP